ncbi:hypothetical protein MBLNU457_5992t1 [Dothideomycetes sp. NU457]
MLAPSRATKDARSMSAASIISRGHSYNPSMPPPGSFTTDLKSTASRYDGTRTDLNNWAAFDGEVDKTALEKKLADYRDKIDKEIKIKIGSENLLEALNAKNAKQTKEQRRFVEAELQASNRKIAQLKIDLDNEIKRSQEQASSPGSRLSQLFRNAPIRSPSRVDTPEELPTADDEFETESPTFLLAEILQALEAQDMPADYYVNHANDLVSLLKRHSTLKYDLAWSIFGLRMQVMLLSDSREVVAAGYRVMRHAITDRKSLQTIRSHHTDFLVILSLVKESKARVEREQALKFVRAFLDVKDGVHEIEASIVRIIVAIAEHSEDRLRPLCIMTLAEMLIRSPELVIGSGGIGVLTEAMGDGSYHAPETLATCFLHLLDLPAKRNLLRSGFELSAAFSSFTEPPDSHGYEERLRASSKVVSSLFKSWSGLMTLSLHNFLAIRSLVSSLYISSEAVRAALLELLFDILRIRPPSWSSSFLAGRRLTTYGRVTNLRAEANDAEPNPIASDNTGKVSLVHHFSAVVLALLLRGGLLGALLHAENDSPDLSLRRKTTLLIGEVLTRANQLLPSSWSAELQTLPEMFRSATSFGLDDRFTALATIYQVDSVNRTLYRSAPSKQIVQKPKPIEESYASFRPAESSKNQLSPNIDEVQFRSILLESQVLSTVNFTKWRWDLIQAVIDGPLTNAKRLDEAMKATKFVHRLLGFLRPFKYRFSEVKNTKPNQRYVRAGCSLIKTLLQTTDGSKYLAENKLVPQIAECLAQFDRLSGITSANPLFSPDRLSDTLVGGYFAFLGILCSESRGLQMMERWRIINMFYHIVELRDRDDLIKALLTNLDYTIDSHPRIILAKAMISGSKQIRIIATRILRKYAALPMSNSAKGTSQSECAGWAIRLLVTQLYDPEIEVCEVAIKLLEEACNDDESLEYVVKCRPALDHLGEIGAPLLLRFLSTSVGYHYLDGLDYITKEMDDWFLGRNDSYVTLVEASLARALTDVPTKPASVYDENPLPQEFGIVPPHFYKELTRTAEGCKLLRAKGHFEEFTATIIDYAEEQEDIEMILKLKGCLWAVGNVGSMELGSPFLDSSNVTASIIAIAERSEVMTLRGTAFFVLGLISKSLHGQEILAEYSWDDFTKLFSIQSWAKVSERDPLRLAETTGRITDSDPINNQIIEAVVKLGNTVLSNKAAAELNSFKVRKVPGLQSASLFHKVMAVLASHHYRLPASRFVIDLFDKSVLRKIVLEDSEDDSDGSEGEGKASV